MRLSSLFLVVLALLTATVAIAQTNVRVRGTIVAVDGNVMAVKSRDGREFRFRSADKDPVMQLSPAMQKSMLAPVFQD